MQGIFGFEISMTQIMGNHEGRKAWTPLDIPAHFHGSFPSFSRRLSPASRPPFEMETLQTPGWPIGL